MSVIPVPVPHRLRGRVQTDSLRSYFSFQDWEPTVTAGEWCLSFDLLDQKKENDVP